jgi:hypothetical protein
MKKLFVIFLLVSLVPFTVGCNGLWDFDDDDDPVATKTLTAKTILPSSTISAGTNIRAATSYNGLTMTINGITFSPTDAKDLGDGTVEVTYKATVSLTTANAITGNSVEVKVFLSNTEILTTTVNVGTEKAPTIIVKVDYTGATVSVTIIPDGSTTEQSVTTSNYSYTSPTVSSFNVTSVTYGDQTLTPSTTQPTTLKTVSSLNPIFRVTFASAPANLSTADWEVEVTNIDSGNSYTLTKSAFPSLFTTTAISTSVDIKVGTATGKELRANTTYKVTLKTNNLKNTDGTLLDGITGSYYFKTAATTYANTTLDSVSPTTIASGTDQTITLNFSAPVKETPETGSSVTITKNEDITKTLDSDSDDISLAYGADNTEVVLTIHADITPGTYEVSVNNGLWLDKNDNPIEVQTLTFTVE